MTAYTFRRTAPPTLVLALLAMLAPSGVDAQVRRGRAQEQAPRWAPVAIGIRVGWDQQAQGEVIGGQLRIPVVRSGVLELNPNADAILRTGTKEYQYNLDLSYVPGGLRGGLILGGGVGWRDTPVGVEPGEPPTTHFGYNLFVGGRTNVGPVQLELGIRWTFLNGTTYQPNSASLGLSFPLWRGGVPPR